MAPKQHMVLQAAQDHGTRIGGHSPPYMRNYGNSHNNHDNGYPDLTVAALFSSEFQV